MAGDECLKNVAKAVNGIVDELGFQVFRYGGEEFCILLTHITAKELKKIAEEVRLSVENLEIPHENSEVSEIVTISCGIHITIPTAGMSVEQFIHHADIALYKAKEAGRNCVRSYSL